MAGVAGLIGGAAGANGNPGNAGCGAVVCDEKDVVLKKASKSLGVMTNNEAEYAAVISALKKIKTLYGKEKTKIIYYNIKNKGYDF